MRHKKEDDRAKVLAAFTPKQIYDALRLSHPEAFTATHEQFYMRVASNDDAWLLLIIDAT